MLLPLAILAVLLVLNGVFAMSELAMMTSRHSRLQAQAQRGSVGARVALSLARQPTRFLSTVQVGITLIGILAGAFGENALSGKIEPLIASAFPAIADHADTISLVLVVLGITYCSLVIGELVPKRIALAHPEAVATLISRPLQVLSVIAALPVRVLTGSTEVLLKVLGIKAREGDDVSEDDVKSLIARAATTGVFTPQEMRLFQRLMRAGDLVVHDLMVSRTDIVWLDEALPLEQVRVTVGTSPHSHFPVCKGSIDRLVGVVHVKDLIAHGLVAGGQFGLASLMHKPLFVPATMPALRLLDQFQKLNSHVAFVVDEYGGTLGMLTMTDVTRALVGDVARGGSAGTPGIVKRAEGSWLVDGMVPLHEFISGLSLTIEAEESLPDVSTVSGLVMAVLGHIPVTGERLDWQGLSIEVVDMDGARVDKVLVTSHPKQEAAS